MKKKQQKVVQPEQDSDSDSSNEDFTAELNALRQNLDPEDEADSDSEDEEMPEQEKPSTSKKQLNTKTAKKQEQEAEESSSDEEEDDGNFAGNDDEEPEEKETKIPVLNPLSLIKNKEMRMALYRKMKKEKHKKKMQERRARRKAGVPANPGHTIESLREADQTQVTNLDDSDTEELRRELELDNFSSYFERSYEPKVLITFADNPVTKTRKFGLELSRIFPNALVKVRNKSSVKKICKSATREEFTDVVIINEDRRKPNGLLIIHLPNGPTAHFKVLL